MTPSNKSPEQIPEILQRFAKELPEENTTGSELRPAQNAAGTSPLECWREMAQKVQQERDPKKMIDLIEQLIAALDQERCKDRSGKQVHGNASDRREVKSNVSHNNNTAGHTQ